MTTTPPADTVAPTRRERQRQATYEEIVEVSRRLLPSGDVLSLRAVAAEMGMTAPALYRYVDSHQELLLLVCRSIFRDVVDTLVAARDRQPDDDPAAQILASAISFRQWALSHREEFGLLFAN
ncbi:MAG: TetR/AcrR family transcriptional regulator, partial [Nocardioidaceae bacterium]